MARIGQSNMIHEDTGRVIPYSDIMNKRVLDAPYPGGKTDIELAYEYWMLAKSDIPIRIDAKPLRGIKHIEEAILRYAAEFEREGYELSLIVVDHLGSVAVSGSV